MTAMAAAPTILTAVRLEIRNSVNGAPPPPPAQNQKPPGRLPFLSLTKPSWIVRSEAKMSKISSSWSLGSNVYRERRKKPDPPCVVCRGSGRVDCSRCCGQGRTNEVHLAMLPKGEWPKWCRTCGGSGLGYCSRCEGTGRYKYILGFHFKELEEDKHYPARNNQGTQTSADLLLYGDQSD
ncbi:hypothetical protein LguiA_019350 [Lonicera macranthoides]